MSVYYLPDLQGSGVNYDSGGAPRVASPGGVGAVADENEPLLTPLQREYLARNPEASLVDQSADMPGAPISGVGGWLGWLTFNLGVLGPLLGLLRFKEELGFAEVGQEQSAHPLVDAIATWGYFAFYAILSMFAGYRLLKCLRPSTIPIVMACIWLPIVCDFSLILYVQAIDPRTIAGRSGPSGTDVSIARSILWASIWTAYLLRSKRVKNTYYPSHA